MKYYATLNIQINNNKTQLMLKHKTEYRIIFST